MTILRTPDDRFDGLKDYPFAPHYRFVDGGRLRMHYLYEGPSDGPPVLLLHGEPSWSYLYRRIVPPLVAAGCRVLAPDLIGFGRSDKPADRAEHRYERHVAWLTEWLAQVDPRDALLFCQDWGGLLGLRLVAAEPDRFAAVITSNTGLPTGQGIPAAFREWLEQSQSHATLPVSAVLQLGTKRMLDDAELAAYNAPFPDETYKAGPRALPALVPLSPDAPSAAENARAWESLATFDKPFVTAFSDGDPITAGGERAFRRAIPGARRCDPVTLGGGHFIQEDAADAIAALILAHRGG